MYWKMAAWAWRRVSQGRRQISAVLIVLKMERVNATGPSEPATRDGGVIVAIALAAHRRFQAVFAPNLLIIVRTVLAATVAVEDAAP
jgi:hypothetical protein